MVDLKQLIDAIKTLPRYAWALTLVTAILLWGPTYIIGGLGLRDFISLYRPYLGVAFLFLLSVSIVILVKKTSALLWTNFIKEKLQIHWLKDHVKKLTPREKEVLRSYFDKDTKTQSWSLNDGVIGGLVRAQILYRSADVGHSSPGNMYFAFNIQPWAWDYLKKRQHLLEREPATPAKSAANE